jgi:uncharacterized membrane protein YkoI
MQQESTAIRRWRARAGMALAALLVGAGLQAPALAKKVTRNNAGEAPLLVLRDGARTYAGKSIDRIIEAAEKRHHPARVRRVDETTIKGRRVYVLRMQKDGKVWEIKVDAETEKEL